MKWNVHKGFCCFSSVSVDLDCDLCKTAAVPFDECMKLNCGHVVHVTCCMKMWHSNPSRVLQCPYCFARSELCFLEITKLSKSYIGYYRLDSDGMHWCLRLPDMGKQTVAILVTDAAKDTVLVEMMRICEAHKDLQK